MPLLSDSDDDIDLSTLKVPPKFNSPAARYPPSLSGGEERLRREAYEKAGENAILREQLTLQASKHTHALHDLVESHQRASEAHVAELDKLRRQLKSAESELQFAREEMRMKSVIGDSTRRLPSSPQKAASTRSVPQFADGFVVKRPKLTPRGRQAERPQSGGQTDILAIDTLPKSYTLSIQALFKIPADKDPLNTIGALISAKDNPDDQLNDTMRILQNLYSQMDSSRLEKVQPLLVLIFAFCQRGFIPQAAQLTTVESILEYCLRNLKPLAPISSAVETFIVNAVDAAIISTALYALDVLLCAPLQTSETRLFDLIISSKIPLIIEKGYKLFAESHYVLLDERKMFLDTPPEPRLELLFGGILDDKLHYMCLSPYIESYLDTGILKGSIDMEEIVRESYAMQRAAGIWLAASRLPTRFKRSEVEYIFVSQVDSPISTPQLLLISRCVWYLWITLDKTDRSGNNMDELVVACARVAYSHDYPKQVTMWALDILHQSVDPGEMNFIADVMS